MINIRNFNGDLLKIDKKSYKNIGIYYIGYITKKDSKYVDIHSVNPFYFIVDKVDDFTEEKKGNRYLNFAFTDDNSELLKKYAELWHGIKHLIEKIDNEQGKYKKGYMKVKFSSDYNLLVHKHYLTIVIRSVFEKNNKYYPQIF